MLDIFIEYAEKEHPKGSATSPNPQPQHLQNFVLDMENVFADYLTNDGLRLLEVCN